MLFYNVFHIIFIKKSDRQVKNISLKNIECCLETLLPKKIYKN